MTKSVRGLMVVALGLLAVLSWPPSVPGQSSSAAPAPMASEADVPALRERAAAFWAARVAGDFQAQWQLLEPRWKGRITAQEYGADLGGGRYLGYQVEGATVNGFFGTVKVRVLVQQVLPPSAASRSLSPQVTVVDDGWIRIGGVWYRRLDDAGKAAFPGTSAISPNGIGVALQAQEPTTPLALGAGRGRRAQLFGSFWGEGELAGGWRPNPTGGAAFFS